MAGLGPIPGFMNSPWGQAILGLLVPAVSAGEANRQQEEQNARNINLGQGSLNLWSNAAGRRVPGLQPGINFEGQQFGLPFDSMGELSRFGRGMERRMGRDFQASQGELSQFNDWLNGATQGRSNALLGEYGTMAGNMLGNYGDMANALRGTAERGFGEQEQYARGRVGDVLGRFDRGMGDVLSGFGGRERDVMGAYSGAQERGLADLQSRYQRGLANLEGAGDQERRDINERFDATSGARMADLASRGLGNTTIRTSEQRANERERGGEIGRLNESLRAQRLSTDAALSGDVASARLADASNRSSLLSGLRGDTLGAQQWGLGTRTGLQQGLTGDVLGVLGANAANRTGLEQGLMSGQTGLFNQLAGNRFNLLGDLSGQNLSTEASGRAGMMDLGNRFRGGQTDWARQMGQARLGIGENANAGFLNTLAGVSYPQPSNDWLNSLNTLGQGLGGVSSFNYLMDFANKQSRPETMFLNSLSGAGGGMLGGLGSMGMYGATTGFGQMASPFGFMGPQWSNGGWG